MSGVAPTMSVGGSLRALAAVPGRRADLQNLGALPPGVLDQRRQPVIVPLADDRRVRLVRRAGGIGRARGSVERGDEGVDLALVDERVVRRDAGLAGVAQLSVDDRPGGADRREAPVDDRRRLAAELERHGDQVRAGRPHDGAPDARAAGEHEVVERQRGEGLADVGAARHDRDLIFRKDLPHHGDDQLGRLRRVLGGLQHRAIAGGDGGCERHQAEARGIVPRRDDADDAERLEHDLCGSRTELHGDAPRARTHPAPQVPAQIVDALDGGHDLHDGGLVGGPMAEVGIDRSFEVPAARKNRRS